MHECNRCTSSSRPPEQIPIQSAMNSTKKPKTSLRKHAPTFYPVIYGADEGEDWTSPEVWAKANPSLNETIGIDKVEAACESARQKKRLIYVYAVTTFPMILGNVRNTC